MDPNFIKILKILRSKKCIKYKKNIKKLIECCVLYFAIVCNHLSAFIKCKNDFVFVFLSTGHKISKTENTDIIISGL